jgi:hypothetical protein
MPLLPQEFRDNLFDIANDLQGDDYRRVLKRNLSPALNLVEKEEIKIACERIISFLNGREKEEFIKGFLERERMRKKFRRQSKDGTLNRQDSIKYAGLPESTFYNKVKDFEPVKGENGKNRYKIDDLDKIARLILDSSSTNDSYYYALCINTHYSFDYKRNGYITFKGGEYYKIVDEDEHHKYLFTDRWGDVIRISNNEFKYNFRVKEDLEFDSNNFNEG